MAGGGIGIGFALSPINPYTVGAAHGIAKLETFSGAYLRAALLLTSLSVLCWYLIRNAHRYDSEVEDAAAEELGLSQPLDQYSISRADAIVLTIYVAGMVYMLYGVFTRGWYINEITGIFLAIAVAVSVARRIGGTRFVEHMMAGASSVSPHPSGSFSKTAASPTRRYTG